MHILRKIYRIPYRISFEIIRYFNQRHRYDFPPENNGWKKHAKGPVWGSREIGTMFDPYVYREDGIFKMIVSARKDNQIIGIQSSDGINWQYKQVLLEGISGRWDDMVNRGCLLYIHKKYYLWYTGQAKGKSSIGLAISDNGVDFTRVSEKPVLSISLKHEGQSVMNPCVILDEKENIFKMWYSAGEDYEPDVICYAESMDGIQWTKYHKPVLTKYPQHKWEQYKIGGCQVVKQDDGSFIIYYIGYQNVDVARICVAHSTDGIIWERDDENLLIAPSKDSWDSDATYKPAVLEKNGKLYMWYNGRRKHEEYIGLAIKL